MTNQDWNSETTPARQESPRPSLWESKGGMFQIVLDVVLLVLTGVNLYLIASARTQYTETAGSQSDQLALITRRLDSSDARVAQLNGEFKVASDKLGLTTQELERARAVSASIKKQQQATVKQLQDAITQKASADDLNKLQSDSDVKFENLSDAISGTNESLAGTKSELSGAIARTHDELVTLAHKSDRDYFEFSVSRKRGRKKIGGVAIELVRTSPKKNQFTVNLYFDDKRVEQRDKAFMEPVLFYVQGAPSALELVINKLGKDQIAGYVSTPRGLFAGTPSVLTERPAA